jgi:hypothetical protein
MPETGREELGVAAGVPSAEGMEPGLVTLARDFLAEERGVTLLLMKGLVGVTSSGMATFARGVLVPATRGLLLLEALAEASEGARRGATGVFAVRVVAREGFSGREVLVLLRSMGIVFVLGSN